MFDIGEEESHFLKQFYLGAMLGGLEWIQNRATRISRSTKLGVLTIYFVGRKELWLCIALQVCVSQALSIKPGLDGLTYFFLIGFNHYSNRSTLCGCAKIWGPASLKNGPAPQPRRCQGEETIPNNTYKKHGMKGGRYQWNPRLEGCEQW